jgi:hydrogenase nickel incorporation protein HypA/HybF
VHELTLAQNIVCIVEENARAAGSRRVRSVHLRVGHLTGVIPESMRFCFEICARGTIAEGATLEIERVPVAIRCRDCDLESSAEDYQFQCTGCGGTNVEMIAGRELLVDEMEVE